jgi:hypothetical protein
MAKDKEVGLMQEILEMKSKINVGKKKKKHLEKARSLAAAMMYKGSK